MLKRKWAHEEPDCSSDHRVPPPSPGSATRPETARDKSHPARTAAASSAPFHVNVKPEPIVYVVGDDDDDEPAPAGPYSYARERKERIWRSNKRAKVDLRPQPDARFGQVGAFPAPEDDTPPLPYHGHGDEPGEDGRRRQDGKKEEDDDDESPGNAMDEDGGAGQEKEAWEYLRKVREEARGMPDVFHAGQGSANTTAAEGRRQRDTGLARQNGTIAGEHREEEEGAGYDEVLGELHLSDARYAHGVCWSAPSAVAPEPSMTAQELYYKALCRRFERHRRRCSALKPRAKNVRAPLPPLPPPPLPPGNDPPGHPEQQQPTTMSALTRDRFRHHGRHSLLRVSKPSLSLIASMNDVDVLRVITFLDDDIDHLVGGGRNLPDHFGTWAWLLLGRLSDVGVLSGEEISVVRDLAKRAGWALAVFEVARLNKIPLDASEAHLDGAYRGGDEMASEAEVVGARTARGNDSTGDVENTNGEGPLERTAGDCSSGGQEDEKEEVVPNESTLATLHLIITVAGEFYGQRDLLDSRLLWNG